MRQRFKAKRGEAAAFLEKALFAETDDCILWPFSLKPNGYADVKVAGKMRYAHRMVCMRAHGEPASAELEAAHSCGNRPCVNKRHLRWATHKENHQDRITHGTSNRGQSNGNSKLSESLVIVIRDEYRNGTSQQAIAARHDVSRRSISSVLSGSTWGWVA